jgi:hypothetical protein
MQLVVLQLVVMSTCILTAQTYKPKFHITVYLEFILSNLWFVQNLLGDFMSSCWTHLSQNRTQWQADYCTSQWKQNAVTGRLLHLSVKTELSDRQTTAPLSENRMQRQAEYCTSQWNQNVTGRLLHLSVKLLRLSSPQHRTRTQSKQKPRISRQTAVITINKFIWLYN